MRWFVGFRDLAKKGHMHHFPTKPPRHCFENSDRLRMVECAFHWLFSRLRNSPIKQHFRMDKHVFVSEWTSTCSFPNGQARVCFRMDKHGFVSEWTSTCSFLHAALPPGQCAIWDKKRNMRHQGERYRVSREQLQYYRKLYRLTRQ
jgi:hypothetical protein